MGITKNEQKAVPNGRSYLIVSSRQENDSAMTFLGVQG